MVKHPFMVRHRYTTRQPDITQMAMTKDNSQFFLKAENVPLFASDTHPAPLLFFLWTHDSDEVRSQWLQRHSQPHRRPTNHVH